MTARGLALKGGNGFLISYAFDFCFFIFLALRVLGAKGIEFDFLAFLFWVLWALYEVSGRTRAFFINIHSYLFGFLFLLGVFSIEYSNGFYMYEIDEISEWKDTFWGALACMYAYVRAASFVTNNLDGEVRRVDCEAKYAWYYLLVCCYLLVSLSVIFYHKPALVLQVDRFIYDKVVLGGWGNFTNVGYYFCLGLGIVFFRAKSFFSFFLFLLILISFVLKGHKFSNLIEALFLFIVPYFCLSAIKALRRKIFAVFLGVFLFFGLAISVNLYLFPSFSPGDYLRTRLFQEGQLWWAVAKEPEYEKLHLDELGLEVSSYFSSELREENFLYMGMYKVMRLSAPNDLVEKKIERQSRYTRSTQALLVYYLNTPLAVFVMFIFGLAWGGLLRGIYSSVVNFRLLESILLCRLFYILMKAFKDADIYKVFSLETAFIILLLFVLSASFVRFPRLYWGVRGSLYKR